MRSGRSIFLWGISLFVLDVIAGTFAARNMLGKVDSSGPKQGFFEASLLMIPLLMISVAAYVFFVKYLRFLRTGSKTKGRLLIAISLICLLALTLMISAYLLLLAVGLFVS